MKLVWGDIAVVVADAKKSAKWWQQKCGFEIRDNEGHWITVAPPGSKEIILHLCQNGEHEEGNTGIGFFVDDVAAIEKVWKAKGVKFSVPRREGSASVQARFLDLDGNEYWLFEDDDLKVPTKTPKKKAARKKAAAKKPAAKRASAKAKKAAKRKR